MKSIIIGVITVAVIAGGLWFANLHRSVEKELTSDDLVIKAQLQAQEASQPVEGVPDEQVVQVLASGQFNPDATDSDALHRGSGGVQIVRFGDEAKLVFNEDFQVSNAPDLRVYLSPDRNVLTKEGFNATKDQSIDLGSMRQFSGYQVYDIPAEYDIDDFQSVNIWCEAFGVYMTTANLN